MIQVTVTRPGFGRYTGGSYITGQAFRDEKKARRFIRGMNGEYF